MYIYSRYIIFFCLQPSPLSLSKGLLVPNRYTPNPQYSACATPDTVLVPQLPREKLCFLQEIGEGCFGKVYKGKDIILARKLHTELRTIFHTML